MKKIRYAVVGLGHIAQTAILPGIKNTENSVMSALVSGSPGKLQAIKEMYGVEKLFAYEDYEKCLKGGEIDAVYIALPNDLHREFSERAAKYGIHVLCEKPMAVSVADCESMIRAAQENEVKLMIAYRLHFEEANLYAIETVRSGRLGTPKLFNSVFSMPVNEEGIRLSPRSKGGGPLYDIGIYCINAARYLFQDEPETVLAASIPGNREPFLNIEESISVVLTFPRGRLATFSCTFDGSDVSTYQVVGTRGDLTLKDAYQYQNKKMAILTIDGKSEEKIFKERDEFAAEVSYFSDCILQNRMPEPSGEEGLADLRVIEAAFESLSTGKVIRFEDHFIRKVRPSSNQNTYRPATGTPRLVGVASPKQKEAA